MFKHNLKQEPSRRWDEPAQDSNSGSPRIQTMTEKCSKTKVKQTLARLDAPAYHI